MDDNKWYEQVVDCIELKWINGQLCYCVKEGRYDELRELHNKRKEEKSAKAETVSRCD